MGHMTLPYSELCLQYSDLYLPYAGESAELGKRRRRRPRYDPMRFAAPANTGVRGRRACTRPGRTFGCR